jgi:hypothetical protein
MVNSNKTNGKSMPPSNKVRLRWIVHNEFLKFAEHPRCIKHSNALLNAPIFSSKKITRQKVIIFTPLLFKGKFPIYLGKTQPIGSDLFCGKIFYSSLFWSVL